LDLSHIFRDGRPPEGLPSPIKRSPKIASVFPLSEGQSLGLGHPKPPEIGFLSLKWVETIPWAKVDDEFCEKSSKMRTTHQGEAPKLHLELALTLGICIYNYSALAAAVSAVKVEISGKVDFSYSFQWEKSSLRKSL